MDQSFINSLIENFRRNSGIVTRQTAGITQDESLVRPPVAGNCANWVLGHMLDYRDLALASLGYPKRLLAPEVHEVYKNGSVALENPASAADINELLGLLAKAGDALTEALQSLTPEDLNREASYANNPTNLGSLLTFFAWHETYHLGQLEVLREFIGKNVKPA